MLPTLTRQAHKRYVSQGKQKSSYAIRVLLVEVGAHAWAEPASFAVNVLENTVTDVSIAAITAKSPSRILITYFPQCAASVFGPHLLHSPSLFQWHHCCPERPESSDSGRFL
jgi:hypothetical protein